MHDLAILYEHPAWQEPLFAELEERGIDFVRIDLKNMAYLSGAPAPGRVIFNQASPSAYLRGNVRAVPQALATLRHLERLGADVINGSDAFSMELSKAAQVALLRELDIDHPESVVFNDVEAAIRVNHSWPRLIKPDLGGSGARIQVVEDAASLRLAFEDEAIWAPDNLFLLQEYVNHDLEQGIVRLEILNGELLYPMRVVTHGRFNLCPSPVCNPTEGGGMCEIATVSPDTPQSIVESPQRPAEFLPYPEVPARAVEMAKRILFASNIDVGGVEYLEAPDGRLVFYDVNANSNLRPSIAEYFGIRPFERVVDFLESRIQLALDPKAL